MRHGSKGRGRTSPLSMGRGQEVSQYASVTDRPLPCLRELARKPRRVPPPDRPPTGRAEMQAMRLGSVPTTPRRRARSDPPAQHYSTGRAPHSAVQTSAERCCVQLSRTRVKPYLLDSMSAAPELKGISRGRKRRMAAMGVKPRHSPFSSSSPYSQAGEYRRKLLICNIPKKKSHYFDRGHQEPGIALHAG
jgi:hypothetical protein